MKAMETANRLLGRCLIREFDNPAGRAVRNRYGVQAGLISVGTIVVLFLLEITLGLFSGSISIVANAIQLLSHLANSVVLLVSFWLTGRPATARTPFGHGRMEHLAPLVMSIFLGVSGLQIGEKSISRLFTPHALHYFPALPWILALSILTRLWVEQFVRFLGKRVSSRAILANAHHHRIDVCISVSVILGLVVGKRFHLPQVDGYIGTLTALWLLYMAYQNGREALIPILGMAPSIEVRDNIRSIAKSVEGIEDVHEIIINDYGSMYLISLHVEIPERFGPAKMHEIAERCEGRLRKAYHGEVVCHTDPLMEKTPEVMAVENRFRKIIAQLPQIVGYHDFRVVAESSEKMIVVADIDTAEDVPETATEELVSALNSRVNAALPGVAYCSFYITPKFSY